jgi:hypothetical protein
MAHRAIVLKYAFPLLSVARGRGREDACANQQNDSEAACRDDSLFHTF